MKNNSRLAPIVLFVYNRPIHTQRTVEALLRNELAEQSDLIVYADGPKEDASAETKQGILAVRAYIDSVKGFKSKECHYAEKNIGCADSIIKGITDVVNRYGKVIVVEDDIVTVPYFLRFMNEALEYYEGDSRIFTIGGMSNKIHIPWYYRKDVYMSCRTVSWGWATWLNRWSKANWDIEHYDIIVHPTKQKIRAFNRGGEDLYEMLNMQLCGEIDAWDIRWEYIMHLNDGYTIVPVCSFANNIGLDGSGTHCSNSANEDRCRPLYDKETFSIVFPKKITPNKRIIKAYHDSFSRGINVSTIKKIKRTIKRICSFLFNGKN